MKTERQEERRVRRQKAGRVGGFALLEIVLSIALLLLVWLAAINVVIISKVSASFATHRVQTAYVMQRTIEDLRKRPFSTIAGSTSTVSIDTRATPDNTADDFLGTQVVTVTSPSPYYKRVIVEVRWNEVFFGAAKIMREYCGTYIANDPQAN